jgi:S1-C subfamily serine protease
MSGGKYSNDKPGSGAFNTGHLPPPYKGGNSTFAPPPVWTPPPGALGKPGKAPRKPGKASVGSSSGYPKPSTSLPVQSIVCLRHSKGGGSGTIVAGGQFVLTNAHVVKDGSSTHRMNVWYTSDEDEAAASRPPDVYGEVVSMDIETDLAVLKLLNPSDGSNSTADQDLYPALHLHAPKPELGSILFTLGFPGVGGSTITVTQGIYSGRSLHWGVEYYKTDAIINPGNSGGGAFDEQWRFIGIPTAGTPDTEETTNYGLIRPVKFAVPLIEEAKKRG